MKIKYTFILLTISALFMSSCSILNPSVMMKTDPLFKFDAIEDSLHEYVINPFDELSVSVYTNKGLQLINFEGNAGGQMQTNMLKYQVESDGNVKLPVVGRVQLSGLTVKEAEILLEGKYIQYYQDPFVKLTVTNRRVMVFRAGSTSGTVLPMSNDKFTLIEALAQAGGIDDMSKAYHIKVVRGDLKQPKVYLYNLATMEDMQKANLVLQSNDIIYVEKRGRYVHRTMTEIAPYLTLFNTAILLYVTLSNIGKE
ncbi:MAG: polysaccharide biosynthesis/export family protein [Salinivirgaceae bacterium]|nr:polysaccharide biosynthesis/export family protein [Salinivirgaceae bacterium]